MKRVAVLASGRGSNLGALISAQAAFPSYRVVLMLSNVDGSGASECFAMAVSTSRELRQSLPLCKFCRVGRQGNAESLHDAILARDFPLEGEMDAGDRKNHQRDQAEDDESQPSEKFLHVTPNTSC